MRVAAPLRRGRRCGHACRDEGGHGLRVLILLLCGSLLAACGDAPHDALRFGLAGTPVTLDPRYATDATSARINRLFYRQLVEFDAAQQPVAGLAEWRRLSPLHYRFHLRDGDGRRFHDGSRLTARDVAATYDSILDPATASPHRSGFEMIESITVVDDDTIDFRLARPDVLFPGRLVIGILPAAAIAAGHAFNRAALGSGPFAFVAWPEPGRLQLRRLRDGQACEFLQVKDPTVRILKLQRGELDMVQNDLPPEMIRYAEARPELYVQRGRGSNFAYLGFNMEDPVVQDRAVRAAIAHAINREAIIHYVLGDAARRASALLPPEHWAGHPGLPLLEYDPARARALLAEAGYTAERRPQIEYKTSSDAFRLRLATIIQQQLGEVGIDVALSSYDWGTFYGDIKAGRFQMFSLAWVGIKTPDIFHYAFHSSQLPPAGANRGRYRSVAADRLIDAAAAAEVPAEQARYYRELQALLLAELPYVPLWYEDHVFVAQRGVTGYTIAADGNYDGLAAVRRER